MEQLQTSIYSFLDNLMLCVCVAFYENRACTDNRNGKTGLMSFSVSAQFSNNQNNNNNNHHFNENNENNNFIL